MPSPSQSLATLRPELTGSFEEFSLAMNQAGFIGLRVMPALDVQKASGIFGKIPVEELLKGHDVQRAPGGGYSRGRFTFENQSFTCIEYGAEEPVDDAEATMYADFFSAEQVAAARALHDVMIAQEMRIAAAIFNATTWTGSALTTAPTHEWDDTANAVPITDVTAAKKKVFDGSGLWPNALIINRKVYMNLQQCDQIVNRVKYNDFTDPLTQGISIDALARAFDLDYILIGNGAKNTAIEGQAASIGPIWSDEYAMICRVATGSDIREPCVGRSMHYAEDGSTIQGTMESYREEASRSDIIRCRHQVDEVVTYAAAGHLLSNITT
jgi:hypothetical protein